MPQRLIQRVGRVVVVIARFYLSATGMMLLLTVGLTLILALVVSPTWGLISLTAGLGLVVPYRLMRLDAARVAVHTQLLDLRGTKAVRRTDVEHVQAQLHQVRRDLFGTVASLRDESTALLRSERRFWMDAVGNVRDDLLAQTTDSTQRVLDAEHRGEERLDAATEDLRKAVKDIRSRTELRAQTQMSDIRLGFARRDARLASTDRVVLIISVERAGGTLLLDLLRQHSAIELYPTADIARRLGVSGRRYPTYLTAPHSEGIEVELQPGVGGIVPPMKATDQVVANGHARDRARYAVERVSPSAIQFDAGAFVDRVLALRSEFGGGVQAVYVTREPVESIRSFLSSRARDPDWHPDIPVEFAHDFYRRSYEAIADIHQRLPGPVVTWEELSADVDWRVARLLVELGLEDDISTAHVVAGGFGAATKSMGTMRDRYLSHEGAKPTASSVELGIGSDDPGRAQEAIDRCREEVRRLVGASVQSTRSSPPSP